MEEKLKYIYDDVYRWLVFAETKNGVLITILLVLIERIMSSNIGNNKRWYPVGYCILAFIVASVIILAASFIPYLNNFGFIKKGISKRYCKKFYNKNTIFYGSIYFYSGENKYGELVKKRYNNDAELNDFEKDIVNQIVDVAEMVLIKIWFFENAIRFLIIGLCCSAVILMCCIYHK